MSLMVCRYPELDGANVPQFVRAFSWRAIGFFHGFKFFLFQKKTRLAKNLT